MDKQLDSIGDNSRSLYTFYSAKKLYFAHTESRYLLVEKNETISCPKSLSLTTRNAVVISKDGGMLLFPRS